MERAPETSTAAEDGEDLGLCLVPQKLARTAMFPCRMNSSSSNSIGPTLYNGSSDLYDDAGSGGAAAAAGGASASARTLQPFHSAFRSAGGVGMAVSMRFPFTSSQWQELERQALIYKYMVASMPVPPELLLPICTSSSSSCKTFTDPSTSLTPNSNLGSRTSACFNVVRFSNSADPEPGRCKRTDGKKWRCSRDVAPDQKYCERHMHRGRPARSRKPVEVPAQNQPRRTLTNPDSVAALSNFSTTTGSASSQLYLQQHQTSSGYLPKSNSSLPFPSISTENEPTRYLNSMVGNQPWQLMHDNLGIRTSSNGNGGAPVLQPYEDHLRLNYADFGSSVPETEQNDQCSLYLNTNLTSLDDPNSNQRQPSREFIDAWSMTSRDNPTATGSDTSNGKSNNSSVLEEKNFPISSLTLSMPSSDDSTPVEDMDQTQMGLGVNVPWLSSASLGGPLGEVLQSTAAAGSNSACEGGPNLMADGWGDIGNALDRPPSRQLDSSPSGVLHKTLVSPSNSSSSSSPTTFTAAKSEIALQWLCHSKLSS